MRPNFANEFAVQSVSRAIVILDTRSVACCFAARTGELLCSAPEWIEVGRASWCRRANRADSSGRSVACCLRRANRGCDCMVVSIVEPFIGAPLSETRCLGLRRGVGGGEKRIGCYHWRAGPVGQVDFAFLSAVSSFWGLRKWSQLILGVARERGARGWLRLEAVGMRRAVDLGLSRRRTAASTRPASAVRLWLTVFSEL